MAPYLSQAPGYLLNPDATSDCGYCSVRVADTFLEGVNIYWSERWRNFGLMWVYIVFDIAAAVLLYYFFRVRSGKPSFLAKLGSKKKQGQQTVSQPSEGQGKQEETSDESSSDNEDRPETLHRNASWTENVPVVGEYLNYNLRRTQTNRRNVNII